MERVTFLLEDTGMRIACLLNPASLEVRRSAGLRRRGSAAGGLGASAEHDPWLATGGGATELELELFFDTSIVRGTTIQAEDVRECTRPLADLARNASRADGLARPPRARFLWGLAWNIPVIVRAVSERFEEFNASGVPRRSWMRMRLLELGEPDAAPTEPREDPRALLPAGGVDAPQSGDASTDTTLVVSGTSDQLHAIAARAYGDPSLWRWIAQANDVADPFRLDVGTSLRVPKLPERAS